MVVLRVEPIMTTAAATSTDPHRAHGHLTGWGRRTVIGIPYLFLILLFSVPFLVVLKISVSESDRHSFPGPDQLCRRHLQHQDQAVELHIPDHRLALHRDLLVIDQVCRDQYADLPDHRLPVRLFHGEIACQHAAGAVDAGVAAVLDFLPAARLCLEGLARRQRRHQQPADLAASHPRSDQDDVHRLFHDDRHGVHLSAVHDTAASMRPW